jgi:hypothetical protein
MSPPNINDAEGNDDDPDNEYEAYEDEDETAKVVNDIEDIVDANGRVLNTMPAYDLILNSEVSLQLGNEMTVGNVIQRSVGYDGQTAGTYDDNPTNNTMVYEVEFPDGQVKEYAGNIIAENMISQVDSEGYSLTLMDAIVDYQKRMRQTTQGWKLLIHWNDGSESWVPLKDMKESHPVEVAEFAKARSINNEPAFIWWCRYVLRKRDVILSKMKARIRKTTHKYGVEIPVTLDHAFKLDRENGNTLWRDGLAKEMLNIGITFEILPEGQQPPPTWKKVTGHLVWDVKMDFSRKARWVLDGHRTVSHIGSTYAGVVSRESVRIAFAYAALNGLDVCAADIRNAYLQAPS